jgi:antibiotic biosynthesis monooxygenase (ABM) superfamily enzyme
VIAHTFVADKHTFKREICMKMKMKLIASLKIWIVIYPSITWFLYIFGEMLSVLPLYQRTFLLTLSLVPWIVFAGVPLVDRIIHFLMPGDGKKVA